MRAYRLLGMGQARAIGGTMKFMGRNINEQDGKFIVTTEVFGKKQSVECGNHNLALATMRRLKRNGYHYFDAHTDPTI